MQRGGNIFFDSKKTKKILNNNYIKKEQYKENYKILLKEIKKIWINRKSYHGPSEKDKSNRGYLGAGLAITCSPVEDMKFHRITSHKATLSPWWINSNIRPLPNHAWTQTKPEYCTNNKTDPTLSILAITSACFFSTSYSSSLTSLLLPYKWDLLLPSVAEVPRLPYGIQTRALPDFLESSPKSLNMG